MIVLLILGACWFIIEGDEQRALLLILIALTFAVLRLRPGALRRMYRDAIRQQRGDDGSLFSGSRDDA